MPDLATTIGGLPSEDHAVAAFDKPTAGSVGKVAGDVLFRSLLIGTGMAVAGVRRKLVVGAIGGSLAIEAFVLAFVAARRKAGNGG